jgi:hypothetical protein
VRLPRAIPLLAALSLGACEMNEQSRAPTPPPPPASAGSANELAALPVPVPPPKDRAVQPIEPERLVGLSQDETRHLIGNPSAMRDEPPAVIWTYGSTGCGLEIFFYLDLVSQTFKALTYDLKPKGPKGLQGGACVASMRQSGS